MKLGVVEIAAVKGDEPPAQAALTLPVLVAVMEGVGAAARAETAAAIRQAAAKRVFIRGNMIIVYQSAVKIQ